MKTIKFLMAFSVVAALGGCVAYVPDTHREGYGHHGVSHGRYGDQDRDGIPDRRDRDRDGDGIVNKRDRDRDGDGVPNRYDRNPDNPYRR